MSDVTAAIARRIIRAPAQGRVVLAGIAGGVGVGKSTWAAALSGALAAAGSRAVVVSSDSFLHPNSELDRRGLTLEKGSPASFDVEALEAFLAAAGGGGLPMRIPVHSHLTYDIDGFQEVPEAEAVILDGVNVLQPEIRRHLDLAMYLDADVADTRRWFLERFERLRQVARHQPGSFYAQFAALTDDQSAAIADWTWDNMNLPNLVRHIEPTRCAADLVVRAGPDHSLTLSRGSGS